MKDEQLLTWLRDLKLSYFREQHQALAREAAEKHWTPLDFLGRLIEGEVLRRKDHATQRHLVAARFPCIKVLQQFDWTWPTKINRPQVQNLFRLTFLKDKGNVIFMGGVGLGKTHLATALGYEACLAGHPGALKRIWLLSDGHPNKETEAILPMADRARDAWINVNTIGFGDPSGYDEGLLRAISSRTHNGKFVPVQSLRELSAAMTLPMEGRKRIEVVRKAVFHLMNWKQKNFA